MAQKSSDIGREDTFELANATLDDPSRGYIDTTDSDDSDTEMREMADNTEDQPEDTEQIKGQIEETRREMGQTIDAIQEKLSFSNISDQVSEHVNNAVETAKGAVYQATIGKAVHFMKNVGDGLSSSSIVRTAKNNPYPFILMGLGAGLLAYQSYSGGSKRSRYGRGQRHEFTGGGQGRFDRNQNQEGMLSTARESLTGVTDTVSSAAGNAYNSLSGAASNVYSSTGDVVNRAYDKVGEFGSTAREQYDHYLEENPLALAGVALALGAAVGMAIPSTQYEGELMGEARERIMDKAQSSATQLLDKTKQAVNEASQSVSEQARSLAK